MPRKFELTFQRGAEGRVGRWKKFYRGKAYYLGSGRGKSDLDSYREALAGWTPKNIDSKELNITRRTTTPETMTHAEVATVLRETDGLNQLCILGVAPQ